VGTNPCVWRMCEEKATEIRGAAPAPFSPASSAQRVIPTDALWEDSKCVVARHDRSAVRDGGCRRLVSRREALSPLLER
jgi:hypothetical protein